MRKRSGENEGGERETERERKCMNENEHELSENLRILRARHESGKHTLSAPIPLARTGLLAPAYLLVVLPVCSVIRSRIDGYSG